MAPDEIIATAMLLGAEFQPQRSHGGSMYWYVFIGTEIWTGLYPQKHDAALRFLMRRGYALDFNGEIHKP
ncbi:hypothetical protein [Bradyrhizobium cenepequi]